MTAPPIIATTITARKATNIQFLDMGVPFWFTYVFKYIYYRGDFFSTKKGTRKTERKARIALIRKIYSV
jgi:hypothetical protein